MKPNKRPFQGRLITKILPQLSKKKTIILKIWYETVTLPGLSCASSKLCWDVEILEETVEGLSNQSQMILSLVLIVGCHATPYQLK